MVGTARLQRMSRAKSSTLHHRLIDICTIPMVTLSGTPPLRCQAGVYILDPVEATGYTKDRGLPAITERGWGDCVEKRAIVRGGYALLGLRRRISVHRTTDIQGPVRRLPLPLPPDRGYRVLMIAMHSSNRRMAPA